MKRQPSRGPSPTPTSFSGISNYRNDGYRPSRDKNPPPTPDYRAISRIHFDELREYLAAYLARSQPNARSSARQKLTKLTIQQFHELSTDVYDELVRRKNQNQDEVPFLPVREDFHPKRNQARQKLATLPPQRFEDLSSDVYYELSRRYPEFTENPAGGNTSGSSYGEYPPAEYAASTSPPRATNPSRTSGRTSADRPPDSGYGGSVSSRRPSVDRRRPSEDFPPPPFGNRVSDGLGTSRRKPSRDFARGPDERNDYGRRPSAASDSTTTATVTAAQATTATSQMIIPNKSTIEEEYIEVPFGREARDSSGTMMGDRSRVQSQDNGNSGGFTDVEPDSASEYPSPMSPGSPVAGLNGLNARLKMAEDDDDSVLVSGSGGERPSYGRTSVNSERGVSSSMGTRMRMSGGDDPERMKRDYEYRIATMQSQISSLQRDLGEANERESRSRGSEARVRQLEEELATVRQRFEEQSTAMRNLQKELDEARESQQRERERAEQRARQDEEELEILRQQLDRVGSEPSASNAELMERLQSDMESLVADLTDLQKRNDDLMAAKEKDIQVMKELDSQLKEYKRKYEQAKTELRNIKATSQLYVQQPKFDKLEDQLPVSADGGVVDIHVTAFLSAIDGLLTAGRSNTPARVLSPMKLVIYAVTAITEDVRTFERRAPRERSDIDAEALRALRDKADATLSNLTVAAKTHATSLGMSPVSLLDAAASHVSAAVTEICRTVFIRKATQAEKDQFSYSPSTNGSTSPQHQRKASAASLSGRSRYSDSTPPPTSTSRNSSDASRRRPPSGNSSSDNTNSPPSIFDRKSDTGRGRGGGVSDDSGPADGNEDAWSEIKQYLEAQTNSIVYYIQIVLSGVRSQTPSPSLNENITQIITIVSSIVAVCNSNFPPGAEQQGNEILKELSEHANKLSEAQSQEPTKDTRQVMAKSSYAIANAMKGLMKL
ncbi:hypothetical protein AX16_010665 [Volvariella volvacea WC 439]|nr:hypothetical protein AX16_010665 [Volvariella volvacea WC 439]